jgi:outer membrane protein OmpA-like peptidoglycan-associated protein
MGLIFGHVWPWALAAFFVGAAASHFFRDVETKSFVAPWLRWTGLAFLAGAIVAAFPIASKRYEIYLDSALAVYAGFLIGAALAMAARHGPWREHNGWAMGFVPAAILGAGAAAFSAPLIEQELTQRVAEALAGTGVEAKSIAIEGRDIAIPNSVAANAGAMKNIAAIAGARIATVEGEAPGKAPVVIAAAPEKPLPEPPASPKPPEPKTPEPEVKAPPPVDGPARPEEPETPGVAEHAIRVLPSPSETPPKAPLDPASCAKAIAASPSAGAILFAPGRFAIRGAMVPALDQVALLMKRCPEAKFQIAVYADKARDPGTNKTLSQRRAEAVAGYLSRVGVAAERLSAIGYGGAKPAAAADDESGRAPGRHIEFLLK